MKKVSLIEDKFENVFLIFVIIVSTAFIVIDTKFDVLGFQKTLNYTSTCDSLKNNSSIICEEIRPFGVNALIYLGLAVLGFVISLLTVQILHSAYYSYKKLKEKRR